ncbi:DNA cytosine methyltransferase [Saccharopolyspora shandongensis]|uniref:DNA cytosine methyltransferase n=1 Tax=Saccharopolyspora shandongensis TaxID=418495 RepID=UPI00341C8C0D
MSIESRLVSLEVCAGAGGFALGLEQAGFDPVLLLDSRPVACDTLRWNRPTWDVRCMDLHRFDPSDLSRAQQVDLLAAGLPRVKSAAASNRTRGSAVELGLLRHTISLLRTIRPRGLLIENVPDLVSNAVYAPVREQVGDVLGDLGYRHRWFVLNAADHGVPQDRKQGILVALEDDLIDAFEVPPRGNGFPGTVGDALRKSMSARGWQQVDEWADQANQIAPTLVGGSWDRGGADLGPTGTKRIWATMGVDAGTVADQVPDPGFCWDPSLGRPGMVRLTVEQAAVLQGFPVDWHFAGGKTARYRQVAHASPPPVGRALGRAVRAALDAR